MNKYNNFRDSICISYPCLWRQYWGTIWDLDQGPHWTESVLVLFFPGSVLSERWELCVFTSSLALSLLWPSLPQGSEFDTNVLQSFSPEAALKGPPKSWRGLAVDQFSSRGQNRPWLPGAVLWMWCQQVNQLIAAVILLVAQSCPTLWDPVGCSPPGFLSMGFSRQECWSG